MIQPPTGPGARAASFEGPTSPLPPASPATPLGSRARWHRATGALVLAWLVAAALVVTFHRFLPSQGWLMVHVTLLGAVSNALLVWTAHFTRAITRAPATAGRRDEIARLTLFNSGAIAVILGILTNTAALTLFGMLGVGAAALWHAASILRTLRTSLPGRLRAPARYYAAAALLLIPGALLGWWVSTPPDGATSPILSAHVALNVLGWVGLPILGTLVTLWPTVLRVRMDEVTESRARRALPLLIAALLTVALGSLIPVLAGGPGATTPASEPASTPAEIVARSVVAVGVLGYVAAAAWTLQPAAAVTLRAARGETPAAPATVSPTTAAPRRVEADFPSASLAAGTAWLLGSIAFAGAWMAVAGIPFSSAVSGVVIPLVGGGIVQILLGALGYLLPVMAGGGPQVLRGRIAIVDRGFVWRVVALNAALLFYALPGTSLVMVTTSLAALGVALVSGLRIAQATFTTPQAIPYGTPAGPAHTRAGDVGVVAHPERSNEGDVRVVAHAERSNEGDVGAEPHPRRGATLGARTGGIVAGLMVALLAVVGGIAGDPAAAGVVGPLGGGISTPLAQAEQAPAGAVTRVEVHVEGMRFVPDTVEVPAGNALEITLVNTGDDVHDLVLETGTSTGRLSPGESAVLLTGPVSQDLDGWCSVAGHRQMGMVLAIHATGADGAVAAAGGESSSGNEGGETTAGGASSSGHEEHGSGAGPAAVPDLMGSPGEGWEARDPRLPEPTGAREQHVTLEVSEQVVEVAPGVTQSRWTFGGTAPGPVLRGRIGDTFVITLVNDGTIGHSIDFHAGALAPDGPMRTIQPGESLEYRFTATRAGIWMYHCSTMPMSMHIAQGMYGAVVIEPDGLPDVDHEFVLVQGESYLGPEGGESDAEALAGGAHDLVHFNGYPFQYRHEPLEVGVDERIRIWVLDAGPNVASSFHVVGGQFDTVWMEGEYRLRPGGDAAGDGVGSGGGAQALGLLPAQGGFVELSLPEVGNYPFVSHIMSDAEKGAHGILRVVE